MARYLLSLVCLLIFCLELSHSAKFPSTWKKCPKKDNKECLLKVVPSALYELKDGKREVGIIPLDPWHFDRLELNQGSNSPVNINLTLLDLDILGASRVKYNDIKIDWDKYEIELDITVVDGPAHLIGKYVGSGKVLVLPINGHGVANITLDDLRVVVSLKGEEMMKNGKKHFNVKDGRFTLYPKKTHLYFENIINNNVLLSDNVNKFLNENQQEIMAELNDTISRSIGEGVRQISNQFFKRIPVTDLYT